MAGTEFKCQFQCSRFNFLNLPRGKIDTHACAFHMLTRGVELRDEVYRYYFAAATATMNSGTNRTPTIWKALRNITNVSEELSEEAAYAFCLYVWPDMKLNSILSLRKIITLLRKHVARLPVGRVQVPNCYGRYNALEVGRGPSHIDHRLRGRPHRGPLGPRQGISLKAEYGIHLGYYTLKFQSLSLPKSNASDYEWFHGHVQVTGYLDRITWNIMSSSGPAANLRVRQRRAMHKVVASRCHRLAHDDCLRHYDCSKHQYCLVPPINFIDLAADIARTRRPVRTGRELVEGEYWTE